MDHLTNLIERYPALSTCRDDIAAVYDTLAVCFETNGRLYVCGNGGSAADALHIVGELAKSFTLKRPVDPGFAANVSEELSSNLQGALPAFALSENAALASAFANDCDPEYAIAQQVYAYARKGDCVLGISTSGNSRNIIHALHAAKGRGASALGLTGGNGGKMKDICGRLITVPENETYKIQELHLPVYHTVCLMLEQRFWGSNNDSPGRA